MFVLRKDQVVGEVNQGWTIAKYLLTHEREMIGGFGLTDAGSDTLGRLQPSQWVLKQGRMNNSMLRAKCSSGKLMAPAFALTAERVTDEVKSGHGVGATSAMLKYYGTELNKRRFETMLKIDGSDAMIWEGARLQWRLDCRAPGCAPRATPLKAEPLRVQLNIIAKNILGLG